MRVGGIITTSGLEKRWLFGTQKGSQSDLFLQTERLGAFFWSAICFFCGMSLEPRGSAADRTGAISHSSFFFEC